MTKGTLEQISVTSLPIALDVRSLRLTDEQFHRLCGDNRDLRFELTAQGELVIMPPTGSMTGWRNAKINYRLTAWAENDGTGLTFDSSSGFTLPNGAKRSPDASWIKRERWEAISEKDREGFAPICPDFVLELRSPDDRLSDLKEKMLEYVENGAALGWLIDPITMRAYAYWPGKHEECYEHPEILPGDPVLPGFELKLGDLWRRS